MSNKKSTIDRSFQVPAALRLSAGALGRLAPGLAARVAEAIFLRPPRHRRPDRERAWLEDAMPTSFRHRGETLAAWSWGAGPTVLLVHGWSGRGSQMAAFVAPLVASGHRVVAFDGPAHGDSPGRRSSLPEYAESILAVADELWPLRGVVAHSFGTAATSLALSRGLAVERLVYIAGPARLRHFTEMFVETLGFPPRTTRDLERRIERRFGVVWTEIEPIALARSIEDPPALLAVHDRDDAEVPYEHAEALAEAWPGGELSTTSGLGHRGLLRHPDVVGPAVEFLSGKAEAEKKTTDEPRRAFA